VRLLASLPTPLLEDQVWFLSLDLSGMGDPTSSYATAGIALRVSGALKLHHHGWGWNNITGMYVTGLARI
jgi:hypothetical protein